MGCLKELITIKKFLQPFVVLDDMVCEGRKRAMENASLEMRGITGAQNACSQ